VLDGGDQLGTRGRPVGHAAVQRDDHGVHRHPDHHDRHGPEAEVGQAEPEDQHVAGQEDREAHVVGAAVGHRGGHHRDLQAEAGEEQPRVLQVDAREAAEAPARHQDHEQGEQQGHRHEGHGARVATMRPVDGESTGGAVRHGDVVYAVDGPVARLTIDRPERRNAMSYGVMAGLRESVAAARSDDEVRVVVLTGAGDQAFCAGADLSSIGDGSPGGAGAAAAHEGRGLLAALFRDLWSLGKPTVARVRGYALAGGFGLALACDFVVAADDARFGTPEVKVGLWPYMITVPLLRSMPPKKALELMSTGRRVDAAEAERIGFVTRVVPAGELDAAVDELAATLAATSPLVSRWGRQSFYRALEMRADDALDYLQAMLSVTTLSEDSAEGITAFLEKRSPEWRGR